MLKSKETKNELDLTKGKIFWRMPLFSVPLALTTIFQLLYTSIDLATVSNFGGGSISMGAIGSNSSLINLIVTMFISLSTGANVAISSAKGASNHIKAEKILHTAFVIAVIGGIIAGILGYFMAPILLELMDTPELFIGKASEYLRIYFLGLPFLMIYNFGSQMLRALGDSRRPLYILIGCGLINVGFDYIFVRYLNMDVSGVALATIISQACSATLVVLYFKFSKHTYVNLSFKKLNVDSESLKDVLKIGIPAGIQGLAFCFPNVLIQSSLYTIDNYFINGVAISQAEIVAGAAASSQCEGYIFALVESFSMGSISFVGQNLGAKKEKNIRKTYWSAVFWMCCSVILFIGVVSLFSKQLLSIFITPSDEINELSALLAGEQKLKILTYTYVLDGLMAINGCYLRGMKKSLPPTIIVLLGCTGSRILFLLTLFKIPEFHTIYWLYAAFPISWIIVDIVYIPVILKIQKGVFNTFRNNKEGGLLHA